MDEMTSSIDEDTTDYDLHNEVAKSDEKLESLRKLTNELTRSVENQNRALEKLNTDSSLLNTRISNLRENIENRAKLIRTVIELNNMINRQAVKVSRLTNELSSAETEESRREIAELLHQEKYNLEQLEKDLNQRRLVQKPYSRSSQQNNSNSIAKNLNIMSDKDTNPTIDKQASKLSKVNRNKIGSDLLDVQHENILHRDNSADALLQFALVNTALDYILTPEAFALQVFGFFLFQNYKSRL